MTKENHTASERIPAQAARVFLKYFLLTVGIVCATFLVCRFAGNASYLVSVPGHSGLWSTLAFLLRSQTSAAVLLVLTGLAARGVLCQPILCFSCLWRGMSLGCAVGMLSKGRLILPHAGLVLSLIFSTTLVWLLLAALTEPASGEICRAFVTGNTVRYRSVTRDYMRRFFVLSGVIFTLGSISALLL